MTVVARKVRIPTPAEIRRLRGGRTQAEVAAIVGVKQSVWARWESGQRKPSVRSAMLLDLLRKKKIGKNGR